MYRRGIIGAVRTAPSWQLSFVLPAVVPQIRERALIQYTFPFSSVNLASMAAAFNTTVP
jgi:hypothetical protein